MGKNRKIWQLLHHKFSSLRLIYLIDKLHQGFPQADGGVWGGGGRGWAWVNTWGSMGGLKWW